MSPTGSFFRPRLPSRLLPVSPSQSVLGRALQTSGGGALGSLEVPATPSTTAALSSSLTPPPLDGHVSADAWLKRRLDAQRQETQRAERRRREIARLNSFLS